MKLTLTVNSQPHSVEVDDPEMPLVFVLRDLMGLKGTKYSCLQGACGTCTIHIDGQAARACQTQAADVQGAQITTIEGLSDDGSHPVQQAWVEEQVAQCGWCQPGQIMQAAALISETPEITPPQIADGMSGHLCRCGTAPRILRAVERAAELSRHQEVAGL